MSTAKRMLSLMLDGQPRKLAKVAVDMQMTPDKVHNVIQHLRAAKFLDYDQRGYTINDAGRDRAVHVPMVRRSPEEQRAARNARLQLSRDRRNAVRRAKKAILADEREDDSAPLSVVDPNILQLARQSMPALQLAWRAA